jgi:hypothetical protein
MQIFTDDQGQTWTLAINVGALKRQKAMLPDLDLLNMDPPLAAKLAVDPFLLCDVLFVLLKPQADELGITDVQFGERMGLSLGSAIKAFWQDLSDFFRSLERQDQAQVLTTLQQILREAIEHNAAATDRVGKELKLPMLGAVPPPGSSSTASPASSASTPLLSP